jgi:hypothetical protein
VVVLEAVLRITVLVVLARLEKVITAELPVQ